MEVRLQRMTVPIRPVVRFDRMGRMIVGWLYIVLPSGRIFQMTMAIRRGTGQLLSCGHSPLGELSMNDCDLIEAGFRASLSAYVIHN